jgi:exodeoxyribonuclease VII small subunit
MQLWERGEALAAHCQAQLDQAQSRLDAATQTAGNASEPADEQTHEPEQRP